MVWHLDPIFSLLNLSCLRAWVGKLQPIGWIQPSHCISLYNPEWFLQMNINNLFDDRKYSLQAPVKQNAMPLSKKKNPVFSLVAIYNEKNVPHNYCYYIFNFIQKHTEIYFLPCYADICIIESVLLLSLQTWKYLLSGPNYNNFSRFSGLEA